jgi:hypothetical protein
VASNRRTFLVNALDAEEALDRAIDEATKGNWRAKVMRPDKWSSVKPVDTERFKVTLYVYEA